MDIMHEFTLTFIPIHVECDAFHTKKNRRTIVEPPDAFSDKHILSNLSIRSI